MAWISPIGAVLMRVFLPQWQSTRNVLHLRFSPGSGVPVRTACLSFDVKPSFFHGTRAIALQRGDCARRRNEEETVSQERNGTPVIQFRRPFAPCSSRSLDRQHATESSGHTSGMTEAVLLSRRRGIDAYHCANWNVFFWGQPWDPSPVI